MRISTKPFYKLFSVVHNNFQWMFLVIDRIYDDRIPPKCPQRLRKYAKNKKKLKMWISTKPFYKLFSVVRNNFQWMYLISERIIWWSYSPKYPRKLRKFADNGKPENVNDLLNHATNFSPWFTTTFYECFKSLRGYMMIVSPKCLRKLR